MANADESASPTRILITGANGFVGRHLIAELLDASASPLHILAAVHPHPTEKPTPDTQPSAGWNGSDEGGHIEVVPLDVSDARATEMLIQQQKPQAIYHLAARASGADADREAVFAVNVAGTRNVLEAAANVRPFPRVLVVSTGYVYGNTSPERPAREEDPIGPLWRYGAYTDSKIEMESVARAYRGFALIARPFAHTGPGQTPTFAIPGFARQLARIEKGLEPPEIQVGNLEAQRDYLDVRDVVRAYRLLMAQGNPGEVYNIATGQPVTIGFMLDSLRALCSVSTEIVIDPARLRPVEITCSTGDSLHIRHTVGWQPRIPLEQTLRDTLDYWRAVT